MNAAKYLAESEATVARKIEYYDNMAVGHQVNMTTHYNNVIGSYEDDIHDINRSIRANNRNESLTTDDLEFENEHLERKRKRVAASLLDAQKKLEELQNGGGKSGKSTVARRPKACRRLDRQDDDHNSLSSSDESTESSL